MILKDNCEDRWTTKGETLQIIQVGQKTDIIWSCTGPNSTSFVLLFYKRLLIKINLERAGLVSLKK
jgi:hypothetical protein